MRANKFMLLPLALALLAAANLRVVYEVEAAAETAPGTYTAYEFRRGVLSSLAAAEEVAHGRPEAPELTVSPRLTFSKADGDALELCRWALDRTAGVKPAWRVAVGGEDAGLCSDPTALGEVMEVIIASGAVNEAVSATLTKDVELRRVYVPTEADTDLMALSAKMRGLTEVMSITADGTVRYG